MDTGYYQEIDMAYELGFLACADPIWTIITSGKPAGEKIRLIRKHINRYYEHSLAAQVLPGDKERIKALKDSLNVKA